jgi:RNA polymerase sigma factor (sigma-70 family)
MSSMATVPSAAYADAFREHERFLWGVCYRLTGSAADADDLVQETFMRALERPPARTEAPWRPWLVRVALNLGRDLLRRRRRRGYVGPWLPSPIETGDEESPPAHEPVIDGHTTTEGRYDLLESVSYAFLLALEALTPQQRAVLLLRDVFDYSVRETADALDLSEANVKTTHHRARAAMRDYDRQRCVPTRALQERTREALGQFMASLASGDLAAIEALLAESVRAVNDGAGEFHAARKIIYGAPRVARFHYNIGLRQTAGAHLSVRMVNGLPAVVGVFTQPRPGEPPRFVLHCDVAPDGRISQLLSIVASRKLTAIDFTCGQSEPQAEKTKLTEAGEQGQGK